MFIKKFKSFESMYSAAAAIGQGEFYTKPTSNNEYRVDQIKITYPDKTTIVFKVSREDYHSDILNYKILDPKDGSLQSKYISLYGDCIQLENYQELVFVRCWCNEADFFENDWSGFLYKSETESGFNEIDIKFETTRSPKFDPNMYKNEYNIPKNSMIRILSTYIQESNQQISYKKLMSIKNKFYDYLYDIHSNVNLLTTKIEGISLMTLIYSLDIKNVDGYKYLKPLKINIDNIENMPSSRLLDIIYPE